MLKIFKDFFSSLRSFDKSALVILALTYLLLPVFFWPTTGMPIDIYKKILIFTGTFLALIFWLAGRLQTRTIVLPKNPIIYIVGGLVISTLVSSLFSFSPKLALFGLGVEQDTFLSLGVLALLLFLTSVYIQSKRRVVNYFLSLSVVAAVVIIVQILIINGWFWPAYFSGGAANLIGKWNSLGVFLGLIVITSVIILEMVALPSWRKLKVFLYGLLTFSFLGLVIINMNVVWWLVGLMALFICAYGFSLPRNDNGGRQISKLSLLLMIVSLLMALAGGPGSIVGNKLTELNTRMGVSNLEVRPSGMGTWQVLRRALVEKIDKRPAFVSTLIGVGPNNFSYEWGKNKPAGVNETMFWNVDFTTGVGTLPSMVVGTGLIGLILWLLLLGGVIIYGFRALRYVHADRLNRALVLLSFSATVYLWGAAIFYVPDTVLFALAFISTGVWLGLLTEIGFFSGWSPKSDIEGRLNITFVIIFLVFILLSIVGLYLGLEKYRSISLFRHGVYSLNVENQLDKAQDLIIRAIGSSEQDLYYRAMVDLSLARMNQILSNKNLPQEDLLRAFSQTLSIATTSANRAIYLNRNNYLNYSYSGKLYEALIPLQIGGSYDWALTSYRESLRVNPANPQAYLDLARLEITNKNLSAAEGYLKKALTLKSNFTQAQIILAQLDIQRGNVSAALNRLKQAAASDPQNTEVLFQLGYLQYKNEDFSGAVSTLEKAVSLVPNYSNAKYFLGLSYSKIGEVDKAIREFTDIKNLNPDNTEVASILENLTAGRAPFSNPAPAPVKTDKK